MVTNRSTLAKIRDIIQKHYSQLTISVLGKDVFTPKELKELSEAGVDTSNKASLLSLVYNHNFINLLPDQTSPTSVEDMKAQQSQKDVTPQGSAHEHALENINDKAKQFIDKLKQDTITRIESIVRENNESFRREAIQNLDRPDMDDELMMESSIGKVKQQLKETSNEADRDWLRTAVTEISNAVGIGSTDRIVSDNVGRDTDDVYVFRITVNDARTCKFCKRFYNDTDNSPKLYRLSTLLANGTNYGKKTDSWKPVAVATHPNERCSQTIELKPGFKLTPGGNVTYMGLAEWHNYLVNKLSD